MIRLFFASCLAYAYLKKWRYLLDTIEKYWMSKEPSLDFIKREITELHHTPKTTESRTYFVKSQLKAGYFLLFLFPSLLLAFETYLYHQILALFPLLFLVCYLTYEIALYSKYKNIDLRKK